ncbi:MAG: isoaspartyl peptidase/L-asparaginase [Desulfurococcales archaeon]|nr:isoaspartyl peptidase/L-asparaginase [Desulfurococcales archaeon]
MIIEHVKIQGPGIAVHGGAGEWNIDPEEEKVVRSWLLRSLEVGYNVLLKGDSAIEAVTEAVAVMEDSGVFNAGRGSALNSLGYAELDAGLMDGSTMSVGAVSAVKGVRNAVKLARIIMKNTSHVLLCCDSAENITSALGYSFEKLEIAERQIRRYREFTTKILSGDHDLPQYVKTNIDVIKRLQSKASPIGGEMIPDQGYIGDTVGAVAIDREGRLAAATSTGGIWLKLPGRIGDSPIPGAGFYADPNIACSATGIGEAIMTIALCRTVALASRFMGGITPAIAYSFEELENLPRFRGYAHAGMIIMSSSAELYMAFNTKGMARGYMWQGGAPITSIYK